MNAERPARGLRPRLVWAVFLALPLAVYAYLGVLFEAAVPQALPIAVHSADHGGLSRQLRRSLNASPTLRVVAQPESLRAGRDLLERAEVYALVVIPSDFERDIHLGLQPELSVFLDGQFLLLAKAIRSALLQVATGAQAEINAVRFLSEGEVPVQAFAQAVPLQAQTSALYNLALDYGRFLLPGLFAALYQAFVACLAVFLIREPHFGRSEFLAQARLLLVFMIQGMAILAWLSTRYPPLPSDHQLANSLALLLLLACYLIACQSLGLVARWVFREPIRALSVVGVISAPAFAFMGVTFPGSDMPLFAACWRLILPATHFGEGYVALMGYGNVAAAWPALVGLAIFPLLAGLIWIHGRLVGHAGTGSEEGKRELQPAGRSA